MNSRHDLESGTRLASSHRASWKQAVATIVRPAFRLHHYRAAHNRLLQDAWCELDRPSSRRCNA